ncbi:hypothetical protein P152DRAFT_272972 [Eremomyces bilateralis CBS 781.70]|uniref:Pyridoxamine 5'-phosphate oxidase N-terminal domain-containing protein n=1 Tax=Eremomyces bilateralis CBS 781.70 TaxID=1392243 RepID=A0A6G1G8T0_9PEZI|nr:uncharacterized protein P152DRAFT_272972 [Eremomyces bilateralis CBS 781.70]KAF1814477.1 hypothetical protein P152DRAFT_272972 [Eremomyces bilateralis CBS 781.70]
MPSTSSHSAASLPPEVVTCLQNARFLHLSTCHQNIPHISLMNYTYLPSTPWDPNPVIIMTTTPSSTKTANLLHNPRVALLVHDWVSHRPPTLSSNTGDPESEPAPPTTATPSLDPAPPGPQRPTGLAALLLNLNTSALSSISVTLNGTARLVESEEEGGWLRRKHLENNTPSSAGEDLQRLEEDGGTDCYINDDETKVVLVRMEGGRISDWKGHVRDWVVGSMPGDAPYLNGATA